MNTHTLTPQVNAVYNLMVKAILGDISHDALMAYVKLYSNAAQVNEALLHMIDTFSFKQGFKSLFDLVDFFLTSPSWPIHKTMSHWKINDFVHERLVYSAQIGDLDMVKSLLTTKPYRVNVRYQHDKVLTHAAQYGRLHIVKYLLTSRELTKRPYISKGNRLPMRLAATHGHLDVMEYLLASPELTKHADIDDGDYSLLDTLEEDNLTPELWRKLFRFLLTSPALPKHAKFKTWSFTKFIELFPPKEAFGILAALSDETAHHLMTDLEPMVTAYYNKHHQSLPMNFVIHGVGHAVHDEVEVYL